jgi:long-chain acyl-CoA synthetase
LADGFAIGGQGSRPAITSAGRTVDYAAFRALVDQVHLTASAVGDVASTDVIGTLAAVFAAARAGIPVVVRAAEWPPLPTAALAALPAETFLVVMTSGTSGHARVIARTAASWRSSFEPFTELTGLTNSDSVLLTGPLQATLHLFAAVHTLWLGAHLTDDADRATAVHAVPTVLGDLLERRPPGLRTAVVAGAPLPAQLEARASALGLTLIEYYGAAELSFVAARVAPAPLTAFPGAEIRIVDGRLWARSPYLALGRLSLDPSDRVSFDTFLSADGSVTVGDLASLDDDGVLTIHGRGDLAVLTGGSTVVVEAVEAVIADLPGVLAVAVVGVPHARLGQLMAAAVELDGVSLADVRRAARQRLSGPALPRIWRQMEELPRVGGGKIARGQLTAELAAGRAPELPGSMKSVR